MIKKILFFAIIVMFKLSVFAQNFEVSPLELYFNAEPGGTQTKFIYIKNHNNVAESIILKLNDVSIDSKGNKTYDDAGSLNSSIADWVTIAPSFFELQPNEQKEIAVTITQPADQYSSKWGVIFVSTAIEQTSYTADKTVSAGISISSRLAINVYQTPGSNRSFKATITNLAEVTNGNSDSVRVFSAIINNLEEIITPCKVHLIATNINTGEETDFSPVEFTIYPKSTRKIELKLEQILQKGTYSLAAILDYGSRTNLEGTQIVIKVE